ncbi:hypothetical protein ABIC83_002992 [Roseateles asaccharophilus]|uniref:hypothetical protein n=1 Tax=Roseateles asaccharophilus TaxID=582607 RepID=UPI003837F7E7
MSKQEAHDPWRPSRQPAQTLYDAFQAEAKHRKGRQLQDWIRLEREAVHRAACEYASQHGLARPSIETVERAERYACGSTDYGSKWAYTLTDLMLGTRG